MTVRWTRERSPIAMSQSGETADTIEAVKIAADEGAPIIGISNVVGSHLTRLADATLYTRGGPEISVAATKTYVSQAIAATLLALYLARIRKSAPLERLREIAEGTKLLPAAIDVVLNTSDEVKKVAKKVRKARSVLFLGRYVNFPTALEGALKLKEISYIHAEGYAAGEMKHGPIALLDAKTPVIGIVTEGRVREKTLSNIAESKAREAPIILVANYGDEEAAAMADHVLWVPRVDELLSPIVNVIPLQLLAYHIADIDGKDIDQPQKPRQNSHRRVARACRRSFLRSTAPGLVRSGLPHLRRRERPALGRQHAGDLRGDDRGQSAAVDARPRDGVDHRRVRDAAARDARAQSA